MKKNKPKIKQIPKYPNGGYTEDEFNQSANQTFNASSNTVSAINPLWGAVSKGIGTIGQPIKKELNQTETGRKINYGMGWVFDPLSTAVASQKTNIWTPDEYNQQYIDQQNLNKQNSQEFKMGGMSGMPNAELENEEVFKTTNGQIEKVNFPSHEQGGGKINIPNGTKILSDKLKMNGKTFAKLGAKYTTDKEDKIMSDDKATSSSKATAKLTSEIKQKKLDQLFTAQESMKKDKIASYAKKLGMEMPQQEFKNGGIKQYEKGGYSNSTGTYDSFGNKIAEANGVVPPYLLTNNNNFRDSWRVNGGANTNGFDDYNSFVENQNTEMESMPSITNQNIQNRSQLNSIDNISSNKMEYIPNKYDPYEQAMSSGNEFTKKSTPQPEGDYQNNISNLAGLASLAGPITGLATNKPQTPVNYVSASYIPMSDKAELRANANTAAWNRRMLKGASQGSSYLPNAAAISSSTREADANTISKYANINTQGYNRAAEAKADAANKSMDATAQDRARTRDLNTKYIGDIGTGVAKLARDEKATQQDYKTLGMISSLYPNYKYNQRTGEWNHKTSGAKLSQEEINKIYK